MAVLLIRECFTGVASFRDLSQGLDIDSNILVKITVFSRSTLLKRQQFLTMFYTINSSPVVVNKQVFRLTIIVQCLYVKGNFVKQKIEVSMHG